MKETEIKHEDFFLRDVFLHYFCSKAMSHADIKITRMKNEQLLDSVQKKRQQNLP